MLEAGRRLLASLLLELGAIQLPIGKLAGQGSFELSDVEEEG